MDFRSIHSKKFCCNLYTCYTHTACKMLMRTPSAWHPDSEEHKRHQQYWKYINTEKGKEHTKQKRSDVKDPAIEIITILDCAQQTIAFITCLLTLCIFITEFKPVYSQKGGCYGVVTGIFLFVVLEQRQRKSWSKFFWSKK